MTPEFEKQLHTLECDVMENFPLDSTLRDYLDQMKAENRNLISSQEYVSMSYDITAFIFPDAMKFLPIVLLVEIHRILNSGYEACADCVLFWICDLPQADLLRMTRSQLCVIRQWITLVPVNRLGGHLYEDDRRRIKETIAKVDMALEQKKCLCEKTAFRKRTRLKKWKKPKNIR